MSIHSNHLGVMNIARKVTAPFNYHLQSRNEHFAAWKELEVDNYAICDVSMKAKDSARMRRYERWE